MENKQTTIWSFFLDKIKVTWLLIAAIIFIGSFSAVTLPRESAVDIKVPIGIITTVSEGAEPEDIEELITDVLEQEVSELDGIKKISSTSSRSFSSITVEFNADEDIDDSIRSLRDKVNEAKALLPSDANDPSVQGINISDQAVLTFSLAGDYSLEHLSNISDEITDNLESISGVSQVSVTGGLQRSYTITLNKHKIEGLGISISEITQKIREANIGFPLGNTEIDSYEYGVRLDNKIRSIEDIRDVVIRSQEGKGFLLLSDISTITDGYQGNDVTSKVAHYVNGELRLDNTVTFNVFKSNSASIVTVVKKVKEMINNKQNPIIPTDISYIEILDMAEYVNEDLRVLGTSAVQTIALIIMFLIIFLGVRESLIAATAIPISFFIVFAYMNFIGMKLNGMVLFSLVIGLGLLVDTAIVITEALHENIVRKKMDIRSGSILAVKQYNKPLLSGTLTTVFAFVPMFLVSGIMGEYLKVIPTILIILLSSSYFVAIFIIPAVGARFIKPKNDNKVHYNDKFDKFMLRQTSKYKKVMTKLIDTKKHRRFIIYGSALSFALSLALPITGLLGVSMFPDSDFDYFEIKVELPTGSSSNDTNIYIKNIEKELSQDRRISHFVETSGAITSLQSDRGAGSSTKGSHLGHFTVHLVDVAERSQKSFEISQGYQSQLDNLDGAKITVTHPKGGPPSGDPIEIRLLGDDIENVSVAAENIEEYLIKMPGIASTSTSVDRGAGEFLIKPNREIMNLYNIQLSELSSTVRASLEDYEIDELLLSGEEVSLRIEMDQKANNPNDLAQIPVSRDGISLSEVADIQLSSNISTINHRDKKRYSFVRASVEPGITASEVVKDLQKNMSQIETNGVEVMFGGEAEDISQSLNDLFKSMIVGVILISLVLVIQFNSYLQPFIVISMIPVSLIGVFIGFTLIRFNLSFLAFIGIVGLAGIVVNDAIILVDKININRQNKLSIKESAIEGGMSRMQPIFLTSLTTIFGMIPLIFVNEIWRDFALAIIFGLIFSTMFALVLVPALYVHYQKK